MKANSKPWIHQFADRSEIESANNVIVGEAIESVAYLIPGISDRSTSRPEHLAGFDFVSNVSMGIEFEMTSGKTYSIIWEMEGVADGMFDGISLAPGAAAERGASSRGTHELAAFDVSESDNWKNILGQKVTGTALSWQETGVADSISVWSMRFDFEGHGSIVVALGAPTGRTEEPITYSSDDLVVIFDAEIARSYRPSAAESSAFAD